jgi:hypothetical protein
VLPRKRGEPADAVGPAALRRGEIVVHDARRREAHLGIAPVDVGAGQRDDGDVDARPVHVPDARLVVEHLGERRHEGRSVEMDDVRERAHRLHAVARPAVPAKQREPLSVKHMSVDVDDETHGFSAESLGFRRKCLKFED